MPAPLHASLRWRVVWAHYLDGMSPLEISRSPLRVSLDSAERWIKLFDDTNDVEPACSKWARTSRLMTDDDTFFLISLLLSSPHNMLVEQFRIFCRRRGHRMHLSTFVRAVKQSSFSRKQVRRFRSGTRPVP